jgi:phosphatidylinositol dimannoside acyltransferase
VPVDFFGEHTWMPAGAAKLAIETGAALIPVHCWFTVDASGRESWGMKTEAPLDVSGGVGAATQALADRFAANIAEHPADWHMLQPLWESDLSPARLARIAAAQNAMSHNGAVPTNGAAAADGVAAQNSAVSSQNRAVSPDAGAASNGTVPQDDAESRDSTGAQDSTP